MEGTNAQSVSDLNGPEGFVGSNAGEGAFVGGAKVRGGNYSGYSAELGAGLGVSPWQINAGGTMGINIIQNLRAAWDWLTGNEVGCGDSR